MTTLTHRRLSRNILNRLIDEAPDEPTALTDDHRRSLSARFRAVPAVDHRRLDAWMVERAGQPSGSFRWSPAIARRSIGNAALRRTVLDASLTRFDAVESEVTDQLLRYAAGYARRGSLAWYLATSTPAVLGLVSAEAANWATQLAEAAESLDHPWAIATSDAYYDVARARTTLRGRRDLVVTSSQHRVLLRVRAGAPGKSAGPGLRADLTIDALADLNGASAARIIGLWPEAGVVLSVDGTMTDLRSGARDLVRTAVANQRHHLARAA
ncbi:MAG TPA: hypothetical protein VG246_00120 [Acidimicrobiales bacterium]|nr:hypothetical protein [Acidimicrobiales bacterium]